MKTEYEVIDNLLPKDYFNELKEIVMSDEISWFWNKNINRFHKHNEDDFTSYFTHNLFNMKLSYIYSEYYKHFHRFWSYLNMRALMRMKLNLYPRTDTIEIHEPHIDYDDDHKGCIFSFNTCDGFTKLEDGTKIESVENRALLFNPSKIHSSSSTTNDKARVNININYF
tara:strand:- start:253 stop:759 length:507 start_codon:yes stop_codon:yes gene_type:complete